MKKIIINIRILGGTYILIANVWRILVKCRIKFGHQNLYMLSWYIIQNKKYKLFQILARLASNGPVSLSIFQEY